MKIAYFGCDLFMPCLDVFCSKGHEIMAIFGTLNPQNNHNICDFARQNNIPYYTGKADKQHIQDLEKKGVNYFFSIEYDVLIPLPSSRVLTMNVHPTLLPHGRGQTPLSHLILRYPQYAGVSFHKLTEQFDRGDIIFQSPLQLSSDESLESLLVKLHFKIPQMLDQVLTDLSGLYQRASPQAEGSDWPALTDQDRMLDWHDSVENIQRVIRAFGRFGVVCCIGHEIWLVNHVEIHSTIHSSSPGTVLLNDQVSCVVAILNGIAIIYKDSIIETRPISSKHKEPGTIE